MFFMLPLALILMVEFAWTEAHTPLSTEELEAQIKGATRAGQYSKDTYYITFRDNGNYGVRLAAILGKKCIEG
jgi:hypothetical protein